MRQRVIASLGRLDRLLLSSSLDALLESASRLSESLMLLSAHGRGELSGVVNRRITPRWSLAGCGSGLDWTKSSVRCCASAASSSTWSGPTF